MKSDFYFDSRRAQSCPRINSNVELFTTKPSFQPLVNLTSGTESQFDSLPLYGYQSYVPNGGLLSTTCVMRQSVRHLSDSEKKLPLNLRLAKRVDNAQRSLQAAPGKIKSAAKNGATNYNKLIMQRMAPIRERNAFLRILCQMPITKGGFTIMNII